MDKFKPTPVEPFLVYSACQVCLPGAAEIPGQPTVPVGQALVRQVGGVHPQMMAEEL